MSDKEFVDGLFVNEPKAGAPDFVKASISIKRKDLGNWLRQKDDEWINIDVKESKEGKWYAEVNTWKPEKKVEVPQAAPPSNNFEDDDIPF